MCLLIYSVSTYTALTLFQALFQEFFLHIHSFNLYNKPMRKLAREAFAPGHRMRARHSGDSDLGCVVPERELSCERTSNSQRAIRERELIPGLGERCWI